MKIKSTKFTGLKIIQSKNYKDSRGFFKEDFKKKFFRDKKFVFGCISSSKKNVVRGLHLQTKFSQGKYISVLKGSIFDVAVDLRKSSNTYLKFGFTELTQNQSSLLIPKGFAHGFCTLEPNTLVLYKVDNPYSKEHEEGIVWNDKSLNIPWPVDKSKIILSEKDEKLPNLGKIK